MSSIYRYLCCSDCRHSRSSTLKSSALSSASPAIPSFRFSSLSGIGIIPRKQTSLSNDIITYLDIVTARLDGSKQLSNHVSRSKACNYWQVSKYRLQLGKLSAIQPLLISFILSAKMFSNTPNCNQKDSPLFRYEQMSQRKKWEQQL